MVRGILWSAIPTCHVVSVYRLFDTFVIPKAVACPPAEDLRSEKAGFRVSALVEKRRNVLNGMRFSG